MRSFQPGIFPPAEFCGRGAKPEGSGCSSGIGKATALRLAAAGHTVYATARKPAAIADLGDKGCRLLALDVCDAAFLRSSFPSPG